MTEEELKAMLKELLIITQNIYGACFMARYKSTAKRLAALNKIDTLAGYCYNMEAEAQKKGLWNDSIPV